MVNDGNLARVEWMLLSQATALQSLLSRLVERGMKADLLPHFAGSTQAGTQAGTQYAARTLEAAAARAIALEVLATVKNPPVVFAKQANIAQQSKSMPAE